MAAHRDNPDSSSSLFARVSPDDQILYCNAALATYLGLDKDVLIGASLGAIQQRLEGEMAEFFSRQAVTGNLNRLIVDKDGRIFESSHSSDGAVLDLFLTEVTRADQVLEPFQSSIGLNQEELSEEEIRSILHPERRIISMLRTRTVGLEDLAATLPPTEIRLLLNTFDEEAREAILSCGGSVGDVEAGEMEGLSGIPRYYQDHALRCLRAAFEQFDRFARIRQRLHRVGKQIPALATGIASGEVLVASITAPGFSRPCASGPPAVLAEKLCRLARPGEILIGQFALSSLLGNLPDGWSYLRAENEEPPDLQQVQWEGDEIQPLPEALERQVFLVGPDVENNPDQTAFYFEYLYAVRCSGFDTPVPVMRVIRPEGTNQPIELSEERLLQSSVVQVLGKYKLLEVVGHGGMGKVWKAEDRFGNTVAIKVLNTAEAASEDSVRRFQREAEVMARLPHRNICRVFEIGKYEDVQFISMEYVDGLTLADLLYEGLDDESVPKVDRDARLPDLIRSLRTTRSIATSQGLQPIAETSRRPKQSRILPISRTLALFSKICEGVQFAHDHGILHRDLKPGNVLLREDGEPLVADFGLAKLEEDNEASLSVSGHIVGTIENMSPEQAESSKDVDERADVYSLGTILYQLLTGRRHFESSGNILQDAQTLKTHVPPRPRQINPALDADLELICLKALRPTPADRYRTVAAMLADINRYRRGEVIKARPVTGMDLARKLVNRHKAVAGVAAAAMLAMAVLAVLAFYQINEARIAAEEHAARAEAQAELAQAEARRADMALFEAEQSREEAERKQKEAEAAVREARKSKTNLLTEQQSRQRAEEDSEESRQIREQLELELALLREAESGARQMDSGEPGEEEETTTTASAPAEATTDPPLLQARLILEERLAMERILNDDPDALSASVIDGLHHSSLAVITNPLDPTAHMLKGAYHLIMHEGEEAIASWQQARQLSPERSALAEKSQLYSWIVEENSLGDGRVDVRGVAAALRRYPTRETEQLASLVEIPLADRVTGRPFTIGEALERIGRENPGALEEVRILREPEGITLVLTRADRIENFQVLDLLPVSGLQLHRPGEIHWETLGRMNLRKLILEGVDPAVLPDRLPTGLQNLRVLGLRNMPAPPDLRFLSSATGLEELDLSHSNLSDLTSLSGASLRTINLTGCDPDNLVSLTRLPIEELVLDPSTAANNLKTHLLRFRSGLQVVRIESDPPGQSRAEFFRRQDAGLYRSPAAPEDSR